MTYTSYYGRNADVARLTSPYRPTGPYPKCPSVKGSKYDVCVAFPKGGKVWWAPG